MTSTQRAWCMISQQLPSWTTRSSGVIRASPVTTRKGSEACIAMHSPRIPSLARLLTQAKAMYAATLKATCWSQAQHAAAAACHMVSWPQFDDTCIHTNEAPMEMHGALSRPYLIILSYICMFRCAGIGSMRVCVQDHINMRQHSDARQVPTCKRQLLF